MDVTTFRWILFGLGIIVIVGVFLFSRFNARPKRSRRARRPAAATRREPTLGPAVPPDDVADELDGEPQGQGELAIDEKPAREGPPPPAPDRIVTLYLQARDNHVIDGADLLDAALKAGLEFGDMNIFHRCLDDDPRPLFSLANLTHPGHFDRDAWNTFETRGVALFMTLPAPQPALDTWEAMMATARNLGERLHADILDDGRSTLTRQRASQIREEMRQYDRRNEPVDP